MSKTLFVLFLATRQVQQDLTPYGGAQNGTVQDFSIQEIDLTTNKLIFFWDALDTNGNVIAVSNVVGINN